MTTRQLIPAIVIPLIAWRLYTRVRRNVGRQQLQPKRLKVSIGIFSIVTLLFATLGLRHWPMLGALAGGLALSIPIALYGSKLTKFERSPTGNFYTPNTALGIAISALFIGRLVYRLVTISGAVDLRGATPPPALQSPLTFFLFGLSAGYFIAYQTGVLIRSRPPAV